jgi:hypothetical protein
MKKYYLHSLIFASTISLSACGLFNSSSSKPTPRAMNQDISLINTGTVVNAVSLVPLDIPNPSQPKVVNSAVFRVTEDIFNYPNTAAILIPQNALVTGVYTNDGTICQISWQVIYADYAAMEQGYGALSIAPRVKNTTCDAKLGVRAGQLMNITFK